MADSGSMKTVDYYMLLPHKLELIPEEAGGFAARFPELPGCISCGDTPEAACANAIDAKRAWIEAALEDGIQIYEPSELEAYCMTAPERKGVFLMGPNTDAIKPVSVKSMLADLEEIRRHKQL